jgi:hypothetical protein
MVDENADIFPFRHRQFRVLVNLLLAAGVTDYVTEARNSRGGPVSGGPFPFRPVSGGR